MVFRSKVDMWLLAVLAAAPALLAVDAWRYRSLVIGCVLGLMLLVYGLLVFPVRYTLGKDRLVARSGVIRYVVPYAELREIAPSRSLLASPALSMDRLKLEYGASSVLLISPEPRQAFVQELQRRAPAAVVRTTG